MLAPIWLKRYCRKNYSRSYLWALWRFSLPLLFLASPAAAQILDDLGQREPGLITAEPLRKERVAIAQQDSGESEPAARFGCRLCVQPDYPEAAREQKIEGNPRIEFEVNQDGDVIAAHIVQSSGNAELDQAALEAVMQSRFTLGGQGQTRTIEINFSITDSERDQEAAERRRRTAIPEVPEEDADPSPQFNQRP